MFSTDLLVECLRAFFIFAHLLFFAAAISLVLWSDFSILVNGVDKASFKFNANVISGLLILLWITGLSIVYIDTQFDMHSIMQKPKLVLKLVCVLMLSLNGVALHFFCFKHLVNRKPLERKNAIVMSVCGAISSVNWLFAAFVGSATVLNQFSIINILTIYASIVCLAVLIAIGFSSLIQSRINGLRARERLDALGISSYGERHKNDASLVSKRSDNKQSAGSPHGSKHGSKKHIVSAVQTRDMTAPYLRQA